VISSAQSAWVRARSAARSAARQRAKISSARAGGRGRGGARSAAREVFGTCRRGRRCGGMQVHSPASWQCVPRRVSAWAKARWPAGPQPGVVAMCSSACVGVGEGAVACRSTARRRGNVLLGACRRGRRRGGLQLYRLRAAWGATDNWAAQWHLTRAVGKRFRGAARKALLCSITK